MWQGFVLPKIDPAIAVDLDAGAVGLLARFVRSCADANMALPKGDFHNLKAVAEAMWKQHMASKNFNGCDSAKGNPVLVVTDEYVRLFICSEPYSNTFMLKPVVEALEKEKKGLGWFIWHAIGLASNAGHYVYSESDVLGQYLYELHDLPEFTDRSYAEWLAEMNEEEQPETEDDVDRMCEMNGRWRPSKILSMVGGHHHLLGLSGPDGPAMTSIESVKQWIKKNGKHPLVNLLISAVDLQQGISHPMARDMRWGNTEIEEESIGAAAIITWDNPLLLHEAISEIEQMTYSAGEGNEAYAAITFPAQAMVDQDLFSQLIQAVMLYFENWGRLENLLSQLPLYEETEDV